LFTSPIFSSFIPLPLVSAYLRREFLRFFFLCLSLFLFLAVLVDFFDRLDYLVKYKAPASTIFRYFAFKTPLFISQAAPMAALTAALMSLGILARQRELTALKACGVSLWQIARPLLVTAGVLSLGLWGWNEIIVPHAYRQSRYINTVEIKKRTPKLLLHENGFWYHGHNAFYHIDRFDSRNNTLTGLTIYIIDENFQVVTLVEASRASWQDGQWRFEEAQQKSLSLDAPPFSHVTGFLIQETPDDFALVDMEADEFSSRQLRDYIGDLKRKGLDTTAYQVDYHLKGAMPLAVFAMTLLGIALAVPGARQISLATAVGLALMAGFGYWLLLALTISLGHSGVLSPLLAAWAANSVSLLLGVFFLLGVD
jgi:lipopolysaccharide export system permease protein